MKRVLIALMVVGVSIASIWYLSDRLPLQWIDRAKELVASLEGSSSVGGVATDEATESDGKPAKAIAAETARKAQISIQSAQHVGTSRGQGGGKAIAVKSASVGHEPLNDVISSTGWAVADKKATVAAQSSGLIVSVLASDGAFVQSGAVIAKIDDGSALATIDKDKALVERDNATLSQAQSALSRAESLVKGNAASQETVEQAKATRDSAAATLLSDKATLELDQIALEKTNIRAPFSGRLGELSVTTGSYVTAGTAIVTLVKYDPIYASFSVPSTYFGVLNDAMATGAVLVDAKLLGQTSVPVTGRLSFLDNSIDQASGTLLAKAQFENSDGALWPGQSLEILIHLDVANDAITVPTVSVIPGDDFPFVYQIKDGTAHIARVEVGRSSGELTEIKSGLSVGDRVVIEGQNQLNEGQRVLDQSIQESDSGLAATDHASMAMEDHQ